MAFEPDSSDNIFDTQASTLQSIAPNTYPRADTTLLFAILQSTSQTQAQQQEDIEFVYDSAYVEDATGEELTKKARNLGILRQRAQKATGVVTFQRDSNATQDYTIQAGTVVETVETDPVQFETTETVTLSSGTQSVDANVQAVTGGADGNVAAGAIQSLPSKPTGVDSVTNNQATGDPTLTDTNGDPLVVGEPREDDESLRERVLDTDAVEDGPDPAGIKLALQSVEGVISTTVKTNQEGSTVDGLDPYHSEIIVYGGDVGDIADTLYNTLDIGTLLRLQGGVNGTSESTTLTAELFSQDITVPITRPTPVNIDVTINVVHTDIFAGTDVVKDTLVSYVGGTQTDGSSVVGRRGGENLRVNEMENRVEDVEGVIYSDITLIDSNGDGADDRTTNSNGVPILTVADSEVSRLDASAITANTTEQ